MVKRLFLVILPALICGLAMFVTSCNKDKNSNSALSIYAYSQATTKSAAFTESEPENSILWCTGEEIEWYNGTTGELKLKNSETLHERILNAFLNVETLKVYLGEEELFTLGYSLSVMSHTIDFPVIVDGLANSDIEGIITDISDMKEGKFR